MIIAWDNLLDAATITSVGSQIASLPAVNVQQVHLSRKWHTAAAVTSSFIVIDFGAAVSPRILAVLGTNLTASATYRLRGSATSDGITSPVYDSGTVSAGVKTGYGAIYKAISTGTARYWRLDLTDATLANLQIGRVVLAPSWSPTVNMQYEWSVTALDETRIVRSYGGQSYPDVRPKRRVLSFVLDYMSESEMYTNAFALAMANGVSTDVLAVPSLSSTFLSEQSVWGQIMQSEPLIEPRIGLFRQRFSVAERL